MSRIRTIKPDISLDEKLAELGFAARLFFRDLWCHCDREGRCEDRPKKLKALIMPWDDVDCDILLSELSPHFLVRYEVDGRKYIQVRTFLKHQRPNIKESPSEIPQCPQAILDEHEKDSAGKVPAPIQHLPSTLDKGKGKEGKGMERCPSKAMDSSGFEQFWKEWPEKIGKTEAIKAWEKLRPGPELVRAIIESIKSQEQNRASLLAQNKFCPQRKNPGPWLNSRRWEDETPKILTEEETFIETVDRGQS